MGYIFLIMTWLLAGAVWGGIGVAVGPGILMLLVGAIVAGCGVSLRFERNHIFRQKQIPSSPIRKDTICSETKDAVAQPTNTPAIPAGIRIRRFLALYWRRYNHTPTTSESINIGSNNTAATTGEITKDITGTANIPKPGKPPLGMLERRKVCAGVARRAAEGEGKKSKHRIRVRPAA